MKAERVREKGEGDLREVVCEERDMREDYIYMGQREDRVEHQYFKSIDQ